MTHDDDDEAWLATALAGLEERSDEVKQAFLRRMKDGQGWLPGSMPLLGLELTTIENKQENSDLTEDSNQQAMLAPLLGTITPQHTESLGKSSQRRSPERVCYGKLLRLNGRTSPPKPQEPVNAEAGSCYEKLAFYDLP